MLTSFLRWFWFSLYVREGTMIGSRHTNSEEELSCIIQYKLPQHLKHLQVIIIITNNNYIDVPLLPLVFFFLYQSVLQDKKSDLSQTKLTSESLSLTSYPSSFSIVTSTFWSPEHLLWEPQDTFSFNTRKVKKFSPYIHHHQEKETVQCRSSCSYCFPPAGCLLSMSTI